MGNPCVIITYNGVDGACAAAMALLKYPKADLRISSAMRIGRTFAELLKEKKTPAEAHVCGIGVYCDWPEVSRPAAALKQKGCRILWYCGRGYMEAEKAHFEEFSTPVFSKVGSNTEAICQALGVGGHPRADILIKLAEHDRRILKADHEPEPDESKWMDLLEASTASFFKYRDTESFAASIRKLLNGTFSVDDERRIAVFRKTGYKYVLYGNSPQIRELKQTILKCARYDEPVLITGETGVGKEHVAHLIYEGGPRATSPFFAINCAVFSGNAALANSILFGHVKGAYTGAQEARQGAFVSANGGVLFLDELGELPMEVQTKFLRVLDDGMIFPEGADRPNPETPVSVRVVGATNRDLAGMIRKGQFRADLFHRLSTFTINVPPLRERKEDMEAIIEHFLDELPAAVERRKLTSKEHALLRSYDWPGNVRQLNKVLKQVVYLGTPLAEALAQQKAMGTLTVEEDASQGRDALLPSARDKVRPMAEIRKAYAARALELNGGNWTATAKALGVAQNTLRALVVE